MNWRKARLELIHFITSILSPAGVIIGPIFWYHGNPLGIILTIVGIASIPIYWWNVNKIRNG